MYEKPEVPVTVEANKERTRSPAREKSSSPVSEDDSSPVTSTTDTINESISEGQWLLDRSEGQVAVFPLDEGKQQPVIRS